MSADKPSEIERLLRKQVGDQWEELLLPPPAMAAMQTEVRHFDPENRSLTNRFPVLYEFLNPYHTMQGGLIAGAIDNTIGPLSMLVAPPNVTRQMSLEYHKPIVAELPFFEVTARLAHREKRVLTFEARVTDPEGSLLVTAEATHLLLKRSSA